MDPTTSLWEGILRRASALRRRYGNLADAPQDTWSLVNRVAADKFQGRVDPEARDRGHLYGLWSKAMVSVLNDLSRRERRRGDAAPGGRVSLSDGALAARPETEEAERLAALEKALQALAEHDAAMGERKALIVAFKYFEGLTWEELATAMGSSVRRTRDEWAVARAWLRRELKRQGVELE